LKVSYPLPGMESGPLVGCCNFIVDIILLKMVITNQQERHQR